MSDLYLPRNVITKIVKFRDIVCYVSKWQHTDKTWTGRVVLAVPPEPYPYQQAFRTERQLDRNLVRHAVKAWQIQSKKDGKVNREKPKLI